MTRNALLSDEMWARIEPLLPDRAPRRGGQWSEHRVVVEAICWRFRTGSPWRDLPSDFPSGRRFGGVSTVGPRTALGTGCCSSCRARPTRSRTWSGSSRSTPRWPGRISTLPEHAGFPQGAGSNHTFRWPEPDDHALGRSRGGWSTKTHLSVDRRGRPLSVRLTPGQAGDNPQLLPLIDDIRVPAAGTGGRPRRRPDCVIADKAYPPLDPKSPTPQGNPCRHPREERPDRPPHQQGQSRRAATVLRRRAVPGPQRRRASVQPAQGLARNRHPLRQTRPQLPSRRGPRLHRLVLGAHSIRSVRQALVGRRRRCAARRSRGTSPGRSRHGSR